MTINFYKYHGTGNDFIIINNNNLYLKRDDPSQYLKLCHRKFGIGADGLILVQPHNKHDFEMIYYNSDGKEGSMCGNGARCAVDYAYHAGIINKTTTFVACEGVHSASIKDSLINISMSDITDVEINNDFIFLNSGSPHFVKFVNQVHSLNVYAEGKAIRNSDRFKREGTNVNFVQHFPDHLFVRTYERGVENETLSCGTGVTASVIAASIRGLLNNNCRVKTLGGQLNVYFRQESKNKFTHIFLEGPATMVYKGEIEI